MQNLMAAKSQFRDLKVGDTFDFVDDSNITFNSFYDRCVKTSTRCYSPLEGKLKDMKLRVGSINATVHHVSIS